MSVPIPTSWPRAGANSPNGCATSWPGRMSSSRPDGEWYVRGRPAFRPITQLKRSRDTPDVIRSSSHGGLAGWAGRSAGVKRSESSGHRPRSSRFTRRPYPPNLYGWQRQEAPDHRNALSAATGHERLDPAGLCAPPRGASNQTTGGHQVDPGRNDHHRRALCEHVSFRRVSPPNPPTEWQALST